MFERNISSDSGEFPADYDTMVGARHAYDDDLEYLQNSAISPSQMFQSDSPDGSQRQDQREEMESQELDDDWLRTLLTSEDSFDPDFLENIDMDSLEQKNVQDEGETDLAEDVSLSVSQVSASEDQEDFLIALLALFH